MSVVRYLLFYVVILLANIIQGITGFAGTVLAMPPSLMLVGYPVAKPVLNVLGLLSGIYVFVGHKAHVDWKELKKIVLVMTAGIFGGMAIQGMFVGKESVLYKLLGVFIIFLSVQGGWKLWKEKKAENRKNGKEGQEVSAEEKGANSPALFGILVMAGIVHGIFVSGGPLLIGYLTRKIHDKVRFRATISTVWIFLNSMILASDIRTGLWNGSLASVQLASIPFLAAGMFIGSKLYARMSQRLFMGVTYVLMMVCGISLLVK